MYIHIYVHTCEHIDDTYICMYIYIHLTLRRTFEGGTMIILLQIRKQYRDMICPDFWQFKRTLPLASSSFIPLICLFLSSWSFPALELESSPWVPHKCDHFSMYIINIKILLWKILLKGPINCKRDQGINSISYMNSSHRLQIPSYQHHDHPHVNA